MMARPSAIVSIVSRSRRSACLRSVISTADRTAPSKFPAGSRSGIALASTVRERPCGDTSCSSTSRTPGSPRASRANRCCVDRERRAVGREPAAGHLVVPHADDSFARQAEQLLLGAVGELIASVRADQHQAFGNGVEHLAEPLLGERALGDVHAGDDDAVEPAGRVAQRRGVHRDDPRPALRRHDLEDVLADVRLAAPEPLERMILEVERGAVRRRTAPGDLVKAYADDPVAWDAQQHLLGAVGELVASVRAHDQDAFGDGVDDFAQPPFVRRGLFERGFAVCLQPGAGRHHSVELGADQGDLARSAFGCARVAGAGGCALYRRHDAGDRPAQPPREQPRERDRADPESRYEREPLGLQLVEHEERNDDGRDHREEHRPQADGERGHSGLCRGNGRQG